MAGRTGQCVVKEHGGQLPVTSKSNPHRTEQSQFKVFFFILLVVFEVLCLWSGRFGIFCTILDPLLLSAKKTSTRITLSHEALAKLAFWNNKNADMLLFVWQTYSIPKQELYFCSHIRNDVQPGQRLWQKF